MLRVNNLSAIQRASANTPIYAQCSTAANPPRPPRKPCSPEPHRPFDSSSPEPAIGGHVCTASLRCVAGGAHEPPTATSGLGQRLESP
jgi:hypothetical protein